MRVYICRCPDKDWCGKARRHFFAFTRKRDAERQCRLCRKEPFSGDNDQCGIMPAETVGAKVK